MLLMIYAKLYTYVYFSVDNDNVIKWITIDFCQPRRRDMDSTIYRWIYVTGTTSHACKLKFDLNYWSQEPAYNNKCWEMLGWGLHPLKRCFDQLLHVAHTFTSEANMWCVSLYVLHNTGHVLPLNGCHYIMSWLIIINDSETWQRYSKHFISIWQGKQYCIIDITKSLRI